MKLYFTNKTWLALRSLVFPIITLLPFFLIRWNGAHCFAYNVTGGHVSGMSIDGGPAIFTVAPILFAILFLVTSFIPTEPEKYRFRQRYLKQQLAVSFASICLALPTYFAMLRYSQREHLPNWWCDAHNHLHASVPVGAHFGLGLDLGTVLVLAALYLVSPLVKYYLVRPSNRRIAGQKKEALFQ